jgi:hypothetical protein
MSVPSMAAPSGAMDCVVAPPGHCPKCIAPRAASARACPACGLATLHFRLEEHLPPPFLDVAWRELLSRWGEPKAHRAFLALAQGRGELVAAARLYRIRRALQPEDALAARALGEIVRLALRPTEAAPRTSAAVKSTVPPWRWMWGILALGTCALLMAPFLRGLLN